MGQRNGELRGAAREKIMSAASNLFYTFGIKSTGIDRIVEVSGITKMTLYKYFKSKDDLVSAVLRSREEAWRSWFKEGVMRRAKTAETRLPAVFDALEEWLLTNDFRGSPFHNAIVELADLEHPAHKIAVEHREKNREFVRGLIKEAGFLKADQLTEQIMVLFAGAITAAVIDRSSAPVRAAKKAASILLSHAPKRKSS